MAISVSGGHVAGRQMAQEMLQLQLLAKGWLQPTHAVSWDSAVLGGPTCCRC